MASHYPLSFSIRYLAVASVIGITVFQRVGVPLGSFKVPIIVFVIYSSIVLLILERRLSIDTTKLLFFLVCSVFLLLSTVLANLYGRASDSVSYASLVWLLILYIPFVFVWNENPDSVYEYFIEVFLKVVAILAIVGIFQFVLQYAGVSLSNIVWSRVPENFIPQSYNYDIRVVKSNPLQKSNGVFFLEPPYYSKALAAAILVELLHRGNLIRLCLYQIALVLTFSGTGLTMLTVGGIFLFSRTNNYVRALLIGGFITMVAIVSLSNFGDAFISRIDEFSSPGQSAYKRFIAPYKGIIDLELYNNLLVGHGPGSGGDASDESASHLVYYLKFLYEYGVVPAILFTLLLIICIKGNSVPLALSVPLVLSYLFFAGGMLEPFGLTYILLFCVFFRGADEAISRNSFMKGIYPSSSTILR